MAGRSYGKYYINTNYEGEDAHGNDVWSWTAFRLEKTEDDIVWEDRHTFNSEEEAVAFVDSKDPNGCAQFIWDYERLYTFDGVRGHDMKLNMNIVEAVSFEPRSRYAQEL